MGKTGVFGSFEVHEGFGPGDVGPLQFESDTRAEADAVLERLATEGTTAQLFGVRADGRDNERILLRILVGLRAA